VLPLRPLGSLTETAGTAIVTQIAGDVKDTFNKIDSNQDGTLQVNEVGNLLKEVTGGGAGAKINPEDVKVVMAEIDTDGDGEVSLEEFTNWYLKSEERIKSDIRVAFDRYDGTKEGTVKDGTLTPEEVKKVSEVFVCWTMTIDDDEQ
jgi:calcium-binding protein CML